jgi:hypothetical protein
VCLNDGRVCLNDGMISARIVYFELVIENRDNSYYFWVSKMLFECVSEIFMGLVNKNNHKPNFR